MAELSLLPPKLMTIFDHYTESYAGESHFEILNDDYMPDARRFAVYVSNLVQHHIKLSPDGSEVTVEQFVELLDWPPLGKILRKFLGSEPLLRLLRNQSPTFARRRIELVASRIDSLADKLLSGLITYGEFGALIAREDQFLQLLDYFIHANVTASLEKRERYSLISSAISLRKKQCDRFCLQKKRLDIFVEIFKKYKEIGPNFMFTIYTK